jgi:Tol biopolymer transport system component
MKCEWVEEQLSAYHDHALDARTTEQVRNHVATCASCSAILQDYARFDLMLRDAPRVEPSPELHDRIFHSPEFQAILHGESAPAAPPSGVRLPHPAARLRPQTMRVFIQIIALIVLLSGATAAITKILASRATASFIPCPTALTSGMRLVYRSNHTLKSGTGSLICDQRVQVGALWQVSPDGKTIAYVDATNDTVHLVGADATNDRTLPLGTGPITLLAWSPDNNMLLVGQADPQHADVITLWVANVATGQARKVTVLVGDSITTGPVFSQDDQAFALGVMTTDNTTAAASTSHVIYVFPTQPIARDAVTPVAGQVEVANLGSITVGGPLAALGWTPGADPYLTWAQSVPGQPYLLLGSVRRSLIQTNTTLVAVAGIQVVAAAFTPAQGLWAAAMPDGTIIQLNVSTRQQTPLAQIGAITNMVWSPDGTQLAVTSANTLWLVSATGATKVTGSAGALTPPVWNADGSAIAYRRNGVVMVYVTATGATVAVTAAHVGTVGGFAWSPDRQHLALWGSEGIAVTDTAGHLTATFATTPPEAPQWSSVG